jgi:fructose-bisphosphate aldolase class II
MAQAASEAPVPVVLHLDHGKDLPLIRKAIESGYTSVMFDGSPLPYAENVKQTRQVVRWAREHGVAVEAELGRIPGTEDKVVVANQEALLTDPAEAASFVKETECDSLAISIGTQHGAYKFSGNHHLDLARLKAIRAIVDVPLVLHGASGVREDIVALGKRFGLDAGEMRGIMDKDVVAAIKAGITKVNIDTDLRLGFTAGLHEALAEHPNWFDPRKLFEPGRTLMKQIAKQKMELFGSAGKAPELNTLLKTSDRADH